jgi:protein disulfide-isomerase
LVGHAKIVKTDSAVLADRFKISTWPRLLVSRDGRPSYYNAPPQRYAGLPKSLNLDADCLAPIVPELTASNSHEIMDGKFVVLGILSRDRAEEFELDKREIKNAALEWMEKQTHAFQLERQEMRDAKQLRIEEAEDRNDQRALRAAKSIRIQISEDDRKQVVLHG